MYQDGVRVEGAVAQDLPADTRRSLFLGRERATPPVCARSQSDSTRAWQGAP